MHDHGRPVRRWSSCSPLTSVSVRPAIGQCPIPRTALDSGADVADNHLGHGIPGQTCQNNPPRVKLRKLSRQYQAMAGASADITSSVVTLKPKSLQGPNEVTIATSVARS